MGVLERDTQNKLREINKSLKKVLAFWFLIIIIRTIRDNISLKRKNLKNKITNLLNLCLTLIYKSL
jgi:hypothetical protein